MIVDTDNVLNARALQLIPQYTGGNMQIHLYRARPQRRLIFENRIVAVIDGFDANDRLVLAGASRAAGVVTGPFAERSFGARIFPRWRDLAFDGNFRRPGN